MKHAGASALDRLEPLLSQLRKREGLKEKSRGCFYLRGRGFLHFHEHGEGELYADITVDGADRRLPVTTAQQRKAILQLADKALERQPPKRAD